MYISGFGTIGRRHLEDFEGLRGITGNLDGHRRIWRDSWIKKDIGGFGVDIDGFEGYRGFGWISSYSEG